MVARNFGMKSLGSGLIFMQMPSDSVTLAMSGCFTPEVMAYGFQPSNCPIFRCEYLKSQVRALRQR